MDQLFANLHLLDVHDDVLRNIVSIHSSQNLFDDLTDSSDEWALAQQIEEEVKPPPYQSKFPIIHRPFEDAQWFNAIGWPFRHWQTSRFSDGAFGVWYGSESIETTVYETAHHWFNGLLRDAGFESIQAAGASDVITAERKLYDVRCDAALLNLRPQSHLYSGLTHKTDYSMTHAIGARLHKEGHPGLVTQSARRPQGHNYAIFNPNVLSSPRHHCQLSYKLQGETIMIEKIPGTTWFEINVAQLD